MADKRNPHVYPMKWWVDSVVDHEIVGDQPGITLRDHVAALALVAVILTKKGYDVDDAAVLAFGYADAFLDEREVE